MVQFENNPRSSELALSQGPFLSPDSKVDFFHGSNSSSLEGVIKEGLKPFGELNTVPFSGTLDAGITKGGINTSFISTVKSSLAPKAYDYTTAKLEGWNPYVHEKINQNLIESRAKILSERGSLEEQIAKGAEVSEVDKAVLKHFEQEISRIDTNLDLEKRRLDAWQNLTEEQKDLVKNPFPVLYGIKHAGETTAVRSNVSGERGLSKVEPQNLIIYVLPEHIEKAESLTQSLGSKIPVKSIFELTDNIAESSEWMNNDLKFIRIQHDRAKQDRLLYSEQPAERVKGIELLKNKSPLPGNAESTLILMLEDPILSVQMTAATALGEIGEIESFRHLKSMNPNNPFLKDVIEDSIFKLRIKLDAQYKSRTANL